MGLIGALVSSMSYPIESTYPPLDKDGISNIINENSTRQTDLLHHKLLTHLLGTKVNLHIDDNNAGILWCHVTVVRPLVRFGINK
jgi:hypothetical protein